jgi:hypothetical protein
MSLAARVANLETEHKRILRCPWCRFALRDVPPPVVKHYSVTPDSVLKTKCWYCGTSYVIPLRDQNKQQREVLSLIHNSHPTKQFIDERIHAALIWSHLYRSEVKEYEKAKQAQTGLANREHSSLPYNCTAGSDTWRDPKAKREREALEQRALEFCQAQLERFEHLAGGPESFPLDNTIEQIEKECPTSGYDKLIDDLLQSLGFEKYSQQASSLRSALATCNLHLQALKKREACEMVIWGEALPETVQESSFFEQEKQRETNKALEAKANSLSQIMKPPSALA